MLAQQAMRLIGEEEYLELEKTSEIRHEYVDGYIYS
ncbi:MAG: Uma2 family endonuclease, partial [Methylococcaceae bacterium]